jgi:hypothetical protein
MVAMTPTNLGLASFFTLFTLASIGEILTVLDFRLPISRHSSVQVLDSKFIG